MWKTTGSANGEGQYHQYKLYYSVDGKKWNPLDDKSTTKPDVPYIDVN